MCKENVPEKFTEKLIADCTKEIQNEECFTINYLTEDDYNKSCKCIQSSECNKYDYTKEIIPVCLVISYDDELEYSLKVKITNYNDQVNSCENDYKKYILEKCDNTINLKYSDCVFKEEPTNEIYFYYQCLEFNDEKCQKFYHEPLSEVCLIVQKIIINLY